MPSKCKKIKYRKGRSERPVVKIQKLSTSGTCPKSFPTAPTVSSFGDENQQYFYYGEGGEDNQNWFVSQKSPLEYLRSWVEKQRFIPQDLSDDFLCLFLTGTAYDVEVAKNKLQKYFQSRQEPSFFFRNRDPCSSHIQEIFDKVYVLPLPETTEDGKKIILTGLMFPTQFYCQLEHTKALAMVFDLLIWEKDFGFTDFVIVLDGRGFECPQLLGNKVQNHKTITSLLLDTIPCTLRSFYFLYPPPYLMNVADNRHGIWITVVNSKEELSRCLPADTLPLEFGGNLGHLEDLIVQWNIHMVQCRNFFINFEQRMINAYNRKQRYENEVKTRGKNWVQDMKLEEDEWEFKTRYYEKMRNFIPLKHPAFGSQRNFKKTAKKSKADPLKKCREKAKEEEEAEKTFAPTFLYHGYGKEIRKAQLEAEMEKLGQCLVFSPVRELNIVFY